MSVLQLAYVIALRRIVTGWRLEVVLFLGILLAVALMSSGIIFSELLADASLRRALELADPDEANFSFSSYSDLQDPALLPPEGSVYRRSLDAVDTRVAPRLEPYLRERSRIFETSSFFFTGHDRFNLDDNRQPRGRLLYVDRLYPEHARLVEGRWPSDTLTGPPTREAPLEVAIDSYGAELLQFEAGAEMDILSTSGTGPTPTMPVRVVGVFERADPGGEFWFRAGDSFSSTEYPFAWVPLVTTEETILERVARVYPGSHSNTMWLFYVDRHGVRAKQVDDLRTALWIAENEALTRLEEGSAIVRLDRVLDAYEEQLVLARIPLFLMIFLVVGILIYYLSLVAGLIVKSRTGEIAMLKSRGSTTLQIGVLSLVEGLLLSAPAILLGPLLALGVSRLLGNLFFDSSPPAGDLISAALSPQAFLLGVGGAVLAVSILTVSTLFAARQGIVEFRQAGARPPRLPFMQRYYLDILALAVVALLWWQIESRGSVLVRSVGAGGQEIDYSLLLGPVLLLLGFGLLVMRLFPLAAGLLARLAEVSGPAWLVQALRRVSRDPAIPGALVVLLMLTTALAVFGSAFSATLEGSQRDRALYAAGADVRVSHYGDRTPMSILGVSERAESLGDVAVAEVERTSGHVLASVFRSERVNILAVDADNIEDVAWYRSHFAGGADLGDLAAAISSDKSPILLEGITLPEDATGLSLWVQPGRRFPGSFLEARLRDAKGLYFDVAFGRLNYRGWRRLDSSLTPEERPGSTGFRNAPASLGVTHPATLISLKVAHRFGQASEPGVAFIQDLRAHTPRGDVLLADLSTTDGWQVVENYASPGLFSIETSASAPREGGSPTSTALTWTPGGSRGLVGLRPGQPEKPMPAIVSNSLLEAADARLGDNLAIGMLSVTLPIRAVESADFFPTLHPKEGHFVVVDLKTFNHYYNVHGQDPAGGSNELWANTNGSGLPDQLAAGGIDGLGLNTSDTVLASDLVSQRVTEPLVNAGWGGLLVIMFLALVLASASGVMLFSYMDVRERQTEFALLRTVGFSARQLNGVVWFNLVLVVVFGVGLGTLAGHLIGVRLLPILEWAEEGVRVAPPMLFRTDWLTLLISYLVLGVVAACTVGWLAWLTSKLEVQRVLRIGEG